MASLKLIESWLLLGFFDVIFLPWAQCRHSLKMFFGVRINSRMGFSEMMRLFLTMVGGVATKRRAQSELPISSDFINFEILVFITLPHWILRAILHRIANGFIALNAFFVHPH